MAVKNKMRIQFVGKNASYTIDNQRFDKIKNTAEVDVKIGKELIKTGKFIEIGLDEEKEVSG